MILPDLTEYPACLRKITELLSASPGITPVIYRDLSHERYLLLRERFSLRLEKTLRALAKFHCEILALCAEKFCDGRKYSNITKRLSKFISVRAVEESRREFLIARSHIGTLKSLLDLLSVLEERIIYPFEYS